MHEHRCLVCGYEGDAEFYPRDYMICGCCGTEFGYDDRVLTHRQLRQRWIRNDFPWFDASELQPPNWSPIRQLIAAHFAADLLEILVPSKSASDNANVGFHIPIASKESRIPFQINANAA